MLSSAVCAQTGIPTPLSEKVNGTFSRQVENLKNGARRVKGQNGGVAGVVPATLSCTDAEAVSVELKRWNIRHTVITDRVVTAYIPVALADSVAALETVRSISGSTPLEPSMNKAIEHTGMKQVHAGTGLESPFTGKGVVVGVIDQGFEYTHPAFSDGKSNLRISAVWNRYADRELVTDAEEIRNLQYDGMSSNHGTHVAGIAAGSRKLMNPITFRGNAPDAELVFIPSTFGGAEVLEDVKFLKEYAAEQGKPCVVNMSFGSQGGTHDGRSVAAQAMDELQGEGMLVVQAAGNDAEVNLHARGAVKGNGSPFRVLVQPTDGEALYVNFVSEVPLGNVQLRYSVDAYNTVIGSRRDFTATYDQAGVVYQWTDEPTGKKMLQFYNERWKESLKKNEVLCISLYASDNVSHTFDAWIPLSRYGTFLTTGKFTFTPGDNNYCIDPQGRRPLIIGSYVNKDTFVSYGDGATYTWGWTVGEMSSFSNVGPVVGEWLPMPLIGAPGSGVLSAYGKRVDGFDPKKETQVTNGVRSNGEMFYYGLMSGTSMACPQVAGIVACWLQAYPKLTPEEAVEIIRTTAKNDGFTGELDGEWDAQWGYGKIDAYEGLKECIRRASTDAVATVWDSFEPLTWNKSPEKWQILFNNAESRACISVATVDGKVVARREVKNLAPAHEEVIGLQSLLPGMYVITVQTANYVQSRKFIK